MRRLVVPVLLCASLALSLGACSSDDTDDPDTSPAPAASASASGSADSSGSSGSSGASEAEGEEEEDEGEAEPSAELTSVIDDANRVTPPLESHFFGAGPADTLEEAVAALAEIDLELSPGNVVGSYLYDDADEDFKLCVEGPTGAFATYDTSPMSLFETGESGGCP